MADTGRTLESAARYTRGGGPPAPDHDSDHATRAKRVEVEQRRLIHWAQENGKLGRSRRLPPEFGRGGEHQVYFQSSKRRYIKATLPDRQLGYGIALGSLSRRATPSEYLDRLDLQNLIFHDDIRLERVVANRGKPIIITSQPSIKGVAAAAAAAGYGGASAHSKKRGRSLIGQFISDCPRMERLRRPWQSSKYAGPLYFAH